MDAMREAFEKHMSDDGKWPRVVERHPGGGYMLITAVAGWRVWETAWAASLASLASLASDASELNAREQLVACAEWLGWQDEDMSAGLLSPEDGLKLWRYWSARSDSLPEMADEEVDEDGLESAEKHRIIALGYDPLTLGQRMSNG